MHAGSWEVGRTTVARRKADEPTLSLHRLDGDHYVEDQLAKPGTPLRFTEPIVTDLDPAFLAN